MRKSAAVVPSSQRTTLSGFAIQAVRVDNLTNQWLQITGSLSFIRPYTYGEIDVLNGAGSLDIGPALPPGITAQATPAANEAYVVTIYDTPIPPQPGIPGQVRADTFVATNGCDWQLSNAGAPGPRDVGFGSVALDTLIAKGGGIKRLMIRNKSTSTGKLYVAINSAAIANNAHWELIPGEGVVIAYPYINAFGSGNFVATVPPDASTGYVQVWFDDATTVAQFMALLAL